MPHACVVQNCNTRYTDSIKFYPIPAMVHFPHRPELNQLCDIRRKKWLDALNAHKWKTGKLNCGKICSKHFVSGLFPSKSLFAP